MWLVSKGNERWSAERRGRQTGGARSRLDESLSAASRSNKRLNQLSLLVLGQLWSNNCKLGALINPQLMGCGKCYRDSYHVGDETWGFLGSRPAGDAVRPPFASLRAPIQLMVSGMTILQYNRLRKSWKCIWDWQWRIPQWVWFTQNPACFIELLIPYSRRAGLTAQEWLTFTLNAFQAWSEPQISHLCSAANSILEMNPERNGTETQRVKMRTAEGESLEDARETKQRELLLGVYIHTGSESEPAESISQRVRRC